MVLLNNSTSSKHWHLLTSRRLRSPPFCSSIFTQYTLCPSQYSIFNYYNNKIYEGSDKKAVVEKGYETVTFVQPAVIRTWFRINVLKVFDMQVPLPELRCVRASCVLRTSFPCMQKVAHRLLFFRSPVIQTRSARCMWD